MTVSRKLEGKKLTKPLWICTSRMVKEAANRMGFTQIVEAAGGKVVADTCMVVSPASQRYKKMMTNSGKALVYLPSLCKVEAGLGSTEECIQCATEA